MRIILRALFTVLVLLLKIEDALKAMFSYIKSSIRKLRKKYRLAKRQTKDVYLLIQDPMLRTAKRTISPLSQFFQKIKRIHLPLPNTNKRRKKGRPRIVPFFSKLKYLSIGIMISLVFVFFPMLVFIFLQDLPNPNELALRQSPQTTKIYDKNGILLSQIYATQNRTVIPLSDVPKHLRLATLAIEDKNFYSHPGFDIPAIIRAFRVNLEGDRVQGGSTITQQLIKSSMLTPEKSLSRKFKELILAFWAERIYNKNQILEMYFNQIPYGGTAWGVEAASQTYFGKNTKDLDLAESSFLAGLTSAPTIYSPYGNNPGLWKHRQKEVLTQMVNLGYISQKQKTEAEKEEMHFRRQQAGIYAPHFVEYVKQLLSQKYGLPMLEKGGLSIITTLDLKTQQKAEKIVNQEVANDAYLNLTNGAALITDPRNGDIVGMVGSHDWNDPNGGNVNIATSLRQPGSSIKVITYAAALQKGFTAASMLDDSPVTYISYDTPYSPANYDGKYHGRVTLRNALASSYNIPAVKTLNQIGIPEMINVAKKMGINSWSKPEDYGLSITLGAAEVTMMEMATVYGTFANDGTRIDLNPILKITDSNGNILEQKTKDEGVEVLEKGVSFILSDILADNQARSSAFGPNSTLVVPGHTVSVKTGTTDNKKDNWTDGYTNNYVVIVWVGNNNNAPMSPNLASGITGAAPIWHSIMQELLKTNPETKPLPPPQIVQKECFGRIEYLLKRTENTADCKPLKTYSIENWRATPKNRGFSF